MIYVSDKSMTVVEGVGPLPRPLQIDLINNNLMKKWPVHVAKIDLYQC